MPERTPRWVKRVLIVLAVLAVIAIVQLILSAGGHDTKAHAATVRAARLPHCTKKHPCTKRQARRVLRAGRGHNGSPRYAASRAVKVQVRSARTACRTWRPRIYRVANAGRLYWRGAIVHWCWDWHRVTSARFTLDYDIQTVGRFLGFGGVSNDEPTTGYYNYGRHHNGGYLLYVRFTFTQCVPVIQIGPFCEDHRAWLKEFVHYDGGGYASGNAP
jgi:hypothetical protein